MPGRVVDASVFAAFSFGEPRADEALALLEGANLYAPTLLRYEMASVARKKFHQRPEAEEAIFRNLIDALSLQAEWVSVEQQAALSIALDRGPTTYDASYLYVSIALDLPLVTFDNRLAAACN